MPSAGAWFRARASGLSGCVEVSLNPEYVLVRNSRNPDGPVLTFSLAEWIAFLDGARSGEFDLPDRPSRGSTQPA